MTKTKRGSISRSGWDHVGCPVCGGKDIWCFFEMSKVPAQDGLLWDSRKEAIQAPKGELHLSVCRTCLYIGNELYDPDKVCFSRYDFSLQHSPSFKRFVQTLARRLIKDYGLKNTTVLDVGCGDAFFLKRICTLSGSQGVGIEPGFQPQIAPEDRVRIIRDRFSANQAARINPGMIACRHVLNAVYRPKDLVGAIRKGIRNPACVVYLEVPNAAYTFGKKIVWNLVYEHRSWYLPEGLANLCQAAGLEVLDVRKCWKGEYLSVTARRANAKSRPSKQINHPPASLRLLEDFHQEWSRVVDEWKVKLAAWRKDGIRVVAWGAGARAVSFFAQFDLRGLIDSVVDINPKRWGKFLPVSGVQVAAPESVKDFRPDLILITNPTYKAEIQAQVERMGVKCHYEQL